MTLKNESHAFVDIDETPGASVLKTEKSKMLEPEGPELKKSGLKVVVVVVVVVAVVIDVNLKSMMSDVG